MPSASALALGALALAALVAAVLWRSSEKFAGAPPQPWSAAWVAEQQAALQAQQNAALVQQALAGQPGAQQEIGQMLMVPGQASWALAGATPAQKAAYAEATSAAAAAAFAGGPDAQIAFLRAVGAAHGQPPPPCWPTGTPSCPLQPVRVLNDFQQAVFAVIFGRFRPAGH